MRRLVRLFTVSSQVLRVSHPHRPMQIRSGTLRADGLARPGLEESWGQDRARGVRNAFDRGSTGIVSSSDWNAR